WAPVRAHVHDGVHPRQSGKRVERARCAHVCSRRVLTAPLRQLFVTGALDESVIVRGLRHYPQDIERTIERADRRVHASGAAVFQVGDVLACVVEVAGVRAGGLFDFGDLLNMVPSITNAVLNEHAVVLHVIALVPAGTLPRNRRGQKERMIIRASFEQSAIKTLHVAYNV
ncbi:MAG: hypothetical protein KF766_18460, partial [Rhodocyclaceae bacterium]|nr:hypothetical protein [Rhodocyclaceae bacterium]